MWETGVTSCGFTHYTITQFKLIDQMWYVAPTISLMVKEKNDVYHYYFYNQWTLTIVVALAFFRQVKEKQSSKFHPKSAQ